LANFGGTDGLEPESNLAIDAQGDLFGTTDAGGANYDGTVFEIPVVDGNYEPLTTLVSFNGADGRRPLANLIIDAAGNLIGITYQGGAADDGTVFEVPFANDAYFDAPTTLVSFTGSNGLYPQAGPYADPAGDLFGTTAGNGGVSYGTVFELAGTGFVPFVAAVHEPGSLVLLCTGLLGLGAWRCGASVSRRRHRRQC
jgi:uncharacterized repeat protein (TIGR03803 family)